MKFMLWYLGLFVMVGWAVAGPLGGKAINWILGFSLVLWLLMGAGMALHAAARQVKQASDKLKAANMKGA